MASRSSPGPDTASSIASCGSREQPASCCPTGCAPARRRAGFRRADSGGRYREPDVAAATCSNASTAACTSVPLTVCTITCQSCLSSSVTARSTSCASQGQITATPPSFNAGSSGNSSRSLFSSRMSASEMLGAPRSTRRREPRDRRPCGFRRAAAARPGSG